MTKYTEDREKIFVHAENTLPEKNSLKPAVYIVKQTEDNRKLYLHKTNSLKVVKRVYGDVHKKVSNIFDTFIKRPENNLGVLAFGTKGSGKTLLASEISRVGKEEHDFSTLLINETFDPTLIVELLTAIDERIIVIFDEYDKFYGNIPVTFGSSDKKTPQNLQDTFLPFLSGVTKSNKLIVFTCNNIGQVNDALKNRPERIRYKYEYRGVDEETIQEYCAVELEDKKHLPDIINLQYYLNDQMTFDILATIVDELNIKGSSVGDIMEYMNITKELTTSYNGTGRQFLIKAYTVITGEEIFKDRITFNRERAAYGGGQYNIFEADVHILTEEELETGKSIGINQWAKIGAVTSFEINENDCTYMPDDPNSMFITKGSVRLVLTRLKLSKYESFKSRFAGMKEKQKELTTPIVLAPDPDRAIKMTKTTQNKTSATPPVQ